VDWADQNSCIKTTNTTKATKACPQLCLKLLSCCWVLEASSSQFPRGQRSRAYLISFHKCSSGRLLVGSVKVRPSMTCIYCFLWRPHASTGKAPSPIFDWALVRTLCSLEGLEVKSSYFEQKLHSNLCWSVENRRKIPLSSRTTVEAHSCLLNMHVTFDLTQIDAQQARKQLEAELEKSCVALAAFAVCIQLFWSVQSSPVQSSPVHSPVQSIVQSSPESRFYKDPVRSAGSRSDDRNTKQYTVIAMAQATLEGFDVQENPTRKS